MSDTKKDRIDRAKWLIKKAVFAAMATVNEDGSPHNTPYLFICSNDLGELYWGSNPKSVHSKNIERTGQIYVVLYEASEIGGLYIKAKNARVAEGDELDRALAAHNKIRADKGKYLLSSDYYCEPSEQRMYIADTETFWVNHMDRHDNGKLREDMRTEVSGKELIE